MKIVKTASGKKTIKISKKEWQSIGKKAGWTKTAQAGDLAGDLANSFPEDTQPSGVQHEQISELKKYLLSSIPLSKIEEYGISDAAGLWIEINKSISEVLDNRIKSSINIGGGMGVPDKPEDWG